MSIGVFKSLGPVPQDALRVRLREQLLLLPLIPKSVLLLETAQPLLVKRQLLVLSKIRLHTFCRPSSALMLRVSFYGIGTYVITGGTGKFKRARGFGEFIGLANFPGLRYNCFLRGVISY